jgi:hypothetical protein
MAASSSELHKRLASLRERIERQRVFWETYVAVERPILPTLRTLNLPIVTKDDDFSSQIQGVSHPQWIEGNYSDSKTIEMLKEISFLVLRKITYIICYKSSNMNLAEECKTLSLKGFVARMEKKRIPEKQKKILRTLFKHVYFRCPGRKTIWCIRAETNPRKLQKLLLAYDNASKCPRAKRTKRDTDDTSSTEEEIEESTEITRCSTCSITFASKQCLQKHYGSERHARRETELRQQQKRQRH